MSGIEFVKPEFVLPGINHGPIDIGQQGHIRSERCFLTRGRQTLTRPIDCRLDLANVKFVHEVENTTLVGSKRQPDGSLAGNSPGASISR